MTDPTPQIAVNDKGEAMRFDGSAWVPAPVATNEQGQKLIHNGQSWVPFPSAAPDTVTQGKRAVGQFAQGFNDAIANTVGAPVDAAAWLARKAGIPATNPIGGSESLKKGLDYIATLPGRIHDFTNVLNPPENDPLADNRTSRFQAQGTLEKVAHGVGEGAGNALAIALPAGAIANTARAGTVTQGVAKTLASQPVMQTIAGGVQGGVTEGTGNPWYGTAAGVAVPIVASGVRSLISPVRNALTPQEQNIVGAAKANDIPLTPAQATGSKTLRAIEDTMSKTPLSSGPMGEAIDNQRTALNRAILEKAGVTADRASPDVLERAFKNIGQTFDDLASRTTANIDSQFVNDVQGVVQKYGRKLDTNIAPKFKSYIEDLQPVLQAAQAGGSTPLAGDVYKTIRSDLGRDARKAADPDLRHALNGLMEALDGAVERSVSGPLKTEWQDARRQYSALMTIDRAMQGGTAADRSAGNIPLAAFRQAVKGSDTTGYARGRGQLNELSRVGDFISTRVPDSGTPTREAILNPLKWPVMAGMGLASRAYNSPLGQSYLTNQLAGPTDFRGLYSGQLARQALEQANGGPNALSLKGGR